MTGAEKLHEMIDSGEFAEKIATWHDDSFCPHGYGLESSFMGADCGAAKNCLSCWRKALEGEVE